MLQAIALPCGLPAQVIRADMGSTFKQTPSVHPRRRSNCAAGMLPVEIDEAQLVWPRHCKRYMQLAYTLSNRARAEARRVVVLQAAVR